MSVVRLDFDKNCRSLHFCPIADKLRYDFNDFSTVNCPVTINPARNLTEVNYYLISRIVRDVRMPPQTNHILSCRFRLPIIIRDHPDRPRCEERKRRQPNVRIFHRYRVRCVIVAFATNRDGRSSRQDVKDDRWRATFRRDVMSVRQEPLSVHYTIINRIRVVRTL